jgi:hypothetical protein
LYIFTTHPSLIPSRVGIAVENKETTKDGESSTVEPLNLKYKYFLSLSFSLLISFLIRVDAATSETTALDAASRESDMVTGKTAASERTAGKASKT